jgi:hypothetical protein
MRGAGVWLVVEILPLSYSKSAKKLFVGALLNNDYYLVGYGENAPFYACTMVCAPPVLGDANAVRGEANAVFGAEPNAVLGDATVPDEMFRDTGDLIVMSMAPMDDTIFTELSACFVLFVILVDMSSNEIFWV